MLKLNQIIPLVATPLSLAMVSSVEAATMVQVNGTGNVTGLTGLEICVSDKVICQQAPEDLTENKETNIYDVSFSFGRFDNLFGNPTQPGFAPSSCSETNPDGSNGLCFWNNETDAQLALTEIVDAINAQQPDSEMVFGEVADFGFGINLDNFLIPTGFNSDTGNVSVEKGSYDNVEWIEDLNTTGPSPNSGFVYAQFNFLGTNIVEPEPPEDPEDPTVDPTVDPAGIPEPSSIMGIILSGASLLLTTKKKNT